MFLSFYSFTSVYSMSCPLLFYIFSLKRWLFVIFVRLHKCFLLNGCLLLSHFKQIFANIYLINPIRWTRCWGLVCSWRVTVQSQYYSPIEKVFFFKWCTWPKLGTYKESFTIFSTIFVSSKSSTVHGPHMNTNRLERISKFFSFVFTKVLVKNVCMSE